MYIYTKNKVVLRWVAVYKRMRKTFRLLLWFVLYTLISCNNKPVEPFELTIVDYNYSLAYAVLYKITNKDLTVSFRGELENEKVKTLFTTTELSKRSIRKLSNINIDSLSVLYSTACIRDGNIKSIRFTKKGKSKLVQLENYYHAELGSAIELINGIVPEKYKINFNKNKLIEKMEKCGKFRIIKSWEKYKNKK
jgi:hypothetical protein